MKNIITGIILLMSLNLFSQIKLHQPTEQTQYFLKYLVEGHRNWKVDTHYNDGTVTEIVIYQYKQLFYDLRAVANARVRYMMKNGRLNNILTQFENLSTDYVREQFDQYYSKTKISNYYFTNNYQEYRTISKIGNYASVNHQSVDFEDFDLEVSEEIKRRRKLYYNKLNGIVEEKTNIDEIVEEYINPLQQTLTNSYSICGEKESKQINIALFDPDLGNYETTSEQTQFCKNDKVITLDFLPEEGIEGFYYFMFNNLSFEEVTQLVLNSYHLPFKTKIKVEQKHIYPEDDKSYATMIQATKENQRIIQIRNFYDVNPEGDYIKIEEKSNGDVQVHISYNGI